MGFTRQSALERAKRDLSGRLGLDAGKIAVREVSDADFPDMSLGAGLPDEMSAQMISSGWRMLLDAEGRTYEYRADKYQLRLYNYNGKNFVIDA